MRLQFKQLWQHERQTVQFEKGLLIRSLVEIAYSLIEKIKATLARLEHIVISGNVNVDCSAKMTVIAIVHHLSLHRKASRLHIKLLHIRQKQ